MPTLPIILPVAELDCDLGLAPDEASFGNPAFDFRELVVGVPEARFLQEQRNEFSTGLLSIERTSS